MLVASRIEHTLLRPDCTGDQVRSAVMAASQRQLAAVTVPPVWARFAVTAAASSPITVSVTVGYPLGTHTASAKGLEARLALEEGAAEVTVVPNLSAFKSGHRQSFHQDVAYVAKHCHQVNPDAVVKVLLYADLLTQEELSEAARIVQESGGQFLLFGTYAPQLPPPALVRQWVAGAAMGLPVGMMAAVQTWEEAHPYLEVGLSRLATPWGIKIVQEASGEGGEVTR